MFGIQGCGHQMQHDFGMSWKFPVHGIIYRMLHSSFRTALLLVWILPVAALAQFDRSSDGESRSHNVDILHTTLRVSFDEAQGRVIGDVTHNLTPLRAKIDSVVLDAAEMTIQNLYVYCGAQYTCDTKVRKYWFDTVDSKLVIHIQPPPTRAETLDVRIRYTCTPRKGLYFIHPDSLHPEKPHQIWSQGEGEDNHFWFPCYDYPNDKSTFELYCAVPSSYSVISNGQLVNRQEGDGDTVTWHWKEYLPISSYLITLCAGEFVQASVAGWHDIPVQYWSWKGREKELDSCFRYTPRMMEHLSKVVDFPYPWEKYAQIPVAEFMYGGMENASATTLFDGVLHDKRAAMDYDAMGLIAHELAHQWWGDVVTCRRWRDLWINEGFATFFQKVAFEDIYGRDRYDYDVLGAQRASIAVEAEAKRPIVCDNGLTTNTYSKGASVLHLLRRVLGDVDFFRSLHLFIERHQYACATTEDLRIAFEDATGMNLTTIFDQWLFRSGHPVFDVTTSWDESTRRLNLTVAQTQKKDSLTGFFSLPIAVEINTAAKHIVQTVWVHDSVHLFSLPCPTKPLWVVFDKGNAIPKEVHYTRWIGDILLQLERGSALERGMACNELREFLHRDAAVSALQQTATSDASWLVRLEALSVLSDSDHAEVQPTLVLLTSDPDPRIRVSALEGLQKHPRPGVDSVYLRALAQDSSYGVKRTAINGLAKLDTTGTARYSAAILPYLDSASYRDWLRSAAFNALRAMKYGQLLTPALRIAISGNRESRVAALGAIEQFGKGNPESERIALLCLNDKSHQIRIAASSVLGRLCGSSALPTLRAALARESFEAVRTAMEKAMKSIEGR
jgi:aminopeptidase N